MRGYRPLGEFPTCLHSKSKLFLDLSRIGRDIGTVMKSSMKVLFAGLVVMVLVTVFGAAGVRTASAAPVASLATPVQVAPINGSSAAWEDQPLVFNWNPVTNATSYRLQIAKNSTFSKIVIDQSGISSDGWASQTPLDSMTYYWRVKASNGGSSSGWSKKFKVIIKTPVVTLS